MTEKILYQFTLPYPWKKTLLGIYLITIGVYASLSVIFVYQDIQSGNIFKASFIAGYLILGLIMFGIAMAMRYILIHLDKIKAPIEVWVDEYEVHFRKGRAKMDFSMEGLKSVRVVLDDKMVMLETNYEKDEDWEKGWKVAFKRKNELELVDYKEFIERTFLPFTEVIIRRLKELNPGIKVVKEDRRKKYR